TSFNKKVDTLKRKKEDALHKLQTNYKMDLSPIEEEMAGLQQYFTDLKQQALNEYQQELQLHRQKIDTIVGDYEERKQKIIRENAEAVTLLNSKLSSFRENLQKDRIDETKAFRDKLKALESEFEKDQLTKDRRRKLRLQDNELNRQIIRTKHDVQQQIREQYIKLAEAESNYLQEKSKWRLDGKLLEFDHKLKTVNTELLYQYRQKEIETKIKKRKLKLDHDIELLELKYIEDIAPLEAELSIASAISERDINLLSNDTNFHLNHYGQQEDLIAYEQELFILEQNEQLDLAKIKREHDRSVLSMTTQLLIEKETVIREQQLKNQNLMRELALLSFEQSNLSHELNYLLQKTDKTTSQEYIQKHHKTTLQHHEQIQNLKQVLHQASIEFEDFKLTYLDHIAQIERDQDILAKDLN